MTRNSKAYDVNICVHEYIQRITIPEIIEDEWFKQGYSPAQFVDEETTCSDDVDAAYTNSEV
jgi:hypothetical protein